MDNKNFYHVVTLTSKTEDGLLKNIISLKKYLEEANDNSLKNIAYTYQIGKNHFDYRLGMVSKTKMELKEQCERLMFDLDNNIKHSIIDKTKDDRIAFMFTGQGSQYTGMAKELYESSEVVKNILDESAKLLEGKFEYDFLSYLFNSELSDELINTKISQPAIFALEYALASLWISLGIEPAVLIGHSLGEFTAAAVSKAITFSEGILLTSERGRLMSELCAEGAMLSILSNQNTVTDYLKDSSIEITAINSSTQIVVSGLPEEIEKLNKVLDRDKIINKKLNVTSAFHSRLVEPAIKPFQEVLKKVNFQKAVIPIISDLDGQLMEEFYYDSNYWIKHLREPVNFFEGARTLNNMKIQYLLEIGPTKVLSQLVKQSMDQSVVILNSLDKRQPNWLTMYDALKGLWEQGIKINWENLPSNMNALRIHVPVYSFSNERVNYRDNYGSQAKDKKAVSDLTNVNKEKIMINRDEISLENLIHEVIGPEVVIKSESTFFEIGGDSLSAIQLISRIREIFGIDVLIEDVLTGNLKNLEKKIALTADTSKEKNAKYRIKRNGEEQYHKMSSSQKRMYFLTEGGEDSALYNLVGGIRLKGNFESEKFEEALEILVSKHQQLRATFVIKHSQLEQEILPTISPICYFKDFEKSGEVTKEYLDSYLEDLSNEAFDLEKGPLFKFELFKLSSKDHIFVYKIHHIIFDAGSMRIFLKELNDIYINLCEGSFVSNSKQEQIEYSDYAVWEEENLDKGTMEVDQDYWRTIFEEDYPTQRLPFDYSSNNVTKKSGACLNYQLKNELSEKVSAYVEKNNLTHYMFFFSAFNLLLYYYSNQKDLIVGTSVSGRIHKETENVIGLFVNTLPIRTKIDLDDSVSDYTNKMKVNILNAIDHQLYPYDKIIEELKIEKENPLFNSFFSFEQGIDLNSESMFGANADAMAFKSNKVLFDLMLEVGVVDKTIVLEFGYNTNVFSKETITNFLTNYISILNRMIDEKSSDRTLNHVCSISKADETSFQEMNKTEDRNDSFQSVLQMIKNSDAVAIQYQGDAYSYAYLQEKSDTLAQRLAQNGFKRNQPIALFLERSPQLIISILGVLKAGGCYVPIDSSYPIDRVEYMIKNSEAKFLISQKELINQVRINDLIKLDVNECETLDTTHHHTFESDNDPEELAYIIYTSGSTGKPKGVKVTHRGLSNYLQWASHEYDTIKSGSFPLFTSIAFDLTITSIYLPLISGNKILIEPKELSGVSLLEHLVKSADFVSIKLTPAHMELLIALSSLNGSKMKRLKHVIVGGEELHSSLLKRWFDIYSDSVVYNEYGPTETVVGCIVKKIEKKDLSFLSSKVPIGTPISNTRVYVLDKQNKQVPVGVKGELHIAGDGVAKGYVKNVVLTEERFFYLPWKSEERVYKTGDSVRVNALGEMEYFGRLDTQIKINGFRVEIGEIESELLRHKAIEQCAVLYDKSNHSDGQLIACLKTYAKVSDNELRQFLNKHLPYYMMPSKFVFLPSLPLTNNGKIDKKQLLEFISTNENVEEDNMINNVHSNSEKTIMKLFENELNVKEINREDDFFEIGGNSMKILPIYARLKTMFPTARIQDFYDFRSAKNLAEHYDKQQVPIFNIKEHLPMLGANEIDDTRTNHQEIDDELNRIKKESVGFKHVLFTGATGFLGANLLCELIKNSTAKFYCIVRSVKEMQPFDRLKQTIEYYVGKDNAKRYMDSIEIVSGDFTKSFLGLEKEKYERLAAKIDCIIHCAADVRHYGEHAEFINTNIEGTRVLLELASHSPKIHFHYMSTTSIASVGKNYNEKPVFYESDFDLGQVFENQYLNSKFEAEKLVRTYKSRGVQTTIYRIGNLVGNSQDGKFQSNIDTNAFYRTVKAIILLHAAPIGRNSIDLTTIDYCSKTVTQMILQQNKLEDTYHIRNLNAISWDDCVSAIQNLGYPILKMSERKFQEFVLSMENFEKRKEAISLIISDYQESSKEENQEIIIDCQRTREFNKINGIICPKPNDKLLSILLRYMVDVQFIPKPFNWEWVDNS